MRVLWVSHSAGMLGAERAMMEGVQALTSAGIECHVVLPAGSAIAPLWRTLGVSLTAIPLPWWMSRPGQSPLRSYARFLYRLPKARRAFKALFAEFRPDLVVTNSLVIPGAAIAARSARIPHVWYIHEFGDRDHGFSYDFGRSLSLRLVDRLSNRVIFNSTAVRDHFAGSISAHKARLVPMAVETPPAAAARVRPGPGPFRLVIVGGVSHTKRQEEAIRAVAALDRRGIATRLEIVGPGGPEITEYLESIATGLGVAGSVDFIGETDRPFDHFAAADVALICSRDEAFGRVTVEAMKAGRPIVGAASGATAGLIAHGSTGLLYEPGNPEDLADQIERLVLDPELLRTIARNAQDWARRTFNTASFVAALLAVLREAIEGGLPSEPAVGASRTFRR